MKLPPSILNIFETQTNESPQHSPLKAGSIQKGMNDPLQEDRGTEILGRISQLLQHDDVIGGQLSKLVAGTYLSYLSTACIDSLIQKRC